ncbi:hypothetical protein GP486_000401 [Trichoglossum hirsutum]|uniref:Uncharacterized protein n=1 Tax=Trichoglossum hirsutum TaxID=265104 RepID=A0A9P8RTL4_9PEZI|nr:hypothetical protein GP486_000401 [Trichoglossum hirsutum]
MASPVEHQVHHIRALHELSRQECEYRKKLGELQSMYEKKLEEEKSMFEEELEKEKSKHLLDLEKLQSMYEEEVAKRSRLEKEVEACRQELKPPKRQRKKRNSSKHLKRRVNAADSSASRDKGQIADRLRSNSVK